MTAIWGTPAHDASLDAPAGDQLLLPGLPDHITLEEIVPRLMWRDFHFLKLVSRGWCHVIRTRQTYRARVRAHTTETLVIYDHFIEDSDEYDQKAIALYSLKTSGSYKLPPTPNVDKGIPFGCRWAAVDGKIYVVGGWVNHYIVGSVYMLDLAAGRPWKVCASMRQPRQEFVCGILHGKIYVFGGLDGARELSGTEVYDPKENTWTPIIPIKSMEYPEHLPGHLRIVGEEIVLHDQKLRCPQTIVDCTNAEVFDWVMSSDPRSLKFYNPVKNERRKIESCQMPAGVGFLVRGKLFWLSESAIFVYDVSTSSWMQLHSCEFFGFESIEYVLANAISVVEIENGELLAILEMYTQDDHENVFCRHVVVQSNGHGNKSQETISWHRKDLEFLDWPDDDILQYMYPIQL